MSPVAGILALQGGVEPHARALARLGVAAREVRAPRDLEGLTHLVLPGGESTTLVRLLERFGLTAPLVRAVRAGELACFGTCAGAILLGRPSAEPPPRLGLLDVEVRRNAYGTQLASTVRRLEALGRALDAVFIRAPRFGATGPDVRVLASLEGEPVLVQGPGCLAATFHPELACGEPFLHRHFLEALGPGAMGAMGATGAGPGAEAVA